MGFRKKKVRESFLQQNGDSQNDLSVEVVTDVISVLIVLHLGFVCSLQLPVIWFKKTPTFPVPHQFIYLPKCVK